MSSILREHPESQYYEDIENILARDDIPSDAIVLIHNLDEEIRQIKSTYLSPDEFHEMEETINQAVQSLEEQKLQYSALESQVNAFLRNVQARDLEEANELFEQFKNNHELEDAQEQIASLTYEINEANQNNQQLTKDNNQLRAQVSNLGKQLEISREQIRNLKISTPTQRDVIITPTRDEEFSEIEKLRLEVEDLQAQLHELNQENEEFQTQLDEANQQISNLKEELANAQASNQDSQSLIGNKTFQFSEELTQQIEELNEEIADLKAENNLLKQRQNIGSSSRGSRKDGQKLSELQKKFDQLTEDKQHLEEEFDLLKKENLNQKATIERLQNDDAIATLQDTNASLKNENDQLYDRNQELQLEIDELKAKAALDISQPSAVKDTKTPERTARLSMSSPKVSQRTSTDQLSLSSPKFNERSPASQGLSVSSPRSTDQPHTTAVFAISTPRGANLSRESSLSVSTPRASEKASPSSDKLTMSSPQSASGMPAQASRFQMSSPRNVDREMEESEEVKELKLKNIEQLEQIRRQNKQIAQLKEQVREMNAKASIAISSPRSTTIPVTGVTPSKFTISTPQGTEKGEPKASIVMSSPYAADFEPKSIISDSTPRRSNKNVTFVQSPGVPEKSNQAAELKQMIAAKLQVLFDIISRRYMSMRPQYIIDENADLEKSINEFIQEIEQSADNHDWKQRIVRSCEEMKKTVQQNRIDLFSS